MQLMMSCMMFAPVAMAMFVPTWGMFLGNWQLGSQMNMNQGADTFSFAITETCSHASLDGLLATMQSNETTWTTCADYPETPFPLSFTFVDDEQEISVVLVEYVEGD